MPLPVPDLPSSSPSACPCQGAIDELQSEISVLQAALESTPLSAVSEVESAGSSDSSVPSSSDSSSSSSSSSSSDSDRDV